MSASPASTTATDSKTWFGHPPQLARMFSTEMWERFGFYGMRALLTLYFAQHFVFRDEVVNPLYGAYTSLVYLTPFFGGLIADKYLGHKKTVKTGAIIMCIGYLLLCFGGPDAKPSLEYAGKHYAVEVVKSGEAKTKYIVASDGKYQIKANDDGSIVLTAPHNGTSLPTTLAKGSYKFDGDRSPFYVSLAFLALSLVIVGNGCFKPNIATMVGQLYSQNDPRRDGGFTIFYMGINLGSTLSILLCPLIAKYYGWSAGFVLAAIGMAVAWCLIQFDGGRLKGYGELPAGTPDRSLWVYLSLLAAVPVAWFLMTNAMTTAEAAAGAVRSGTGLWAWFQSQSLMGRFLLTLFTAVVIGVPFYAYKFGSKEEFHMMTVAIVLCIFCFVFFSLFEQAGSSLTLYAERNTQLDIFGWQMPAGQTQSFNAIFIVLCAPLFSILWVWMNKSGIEPSTPVKFALGLILLGAGFLLLAFGARFANGDYRVPMFWLAAAYLLHSLGELCLSPVGLSMITKLSMARLVGMMMGVWYLSVAMGQFGAGLIAGLASTETVGGDVLNPKLSLTTYTGVYHDFGLYTVGVGIFVLLISPLLRRWMHKVL